MAILNCYVELPEGMFLKKDKKKDRVVSVIKVRSTFLPSSRNT